jgi:hypothetical protein
VVGLTGAVNTAFVREPNNLVRQFYTTGREHDWAGFGKGMGHSRLSRARKMSEFRTIVMINLRIQMLGEKK